MLVAPRQVAVDCARLGRTPLRAAGQAQHAVRALLGRTTPAPAALLVLRVQLASTALARGCLLPAVTAKQARTLLVVQLP